VLSFLVSNTSFLNRCFLHYYFDFASDFFLAKASIRFGFKAAFICDTFAKSPFVVLLEWYYSIL
jgi:hypothetical protein